MSLQFWLWAGLTLILVLVEVFTVQLVSVWFAGGALAALIASLLGANTLVQVLIFLGLSLILLLALKPLAKKRLLRSTVATNADAIVGQKCRVLQEVDETGGRVTVANQDWAARCPEGQRFAVGEQAVIQSISGVTLLIIAEQKED